MDNAHNGPASTGGESVRFQLFVAGETPRSRRAIENLQRIVRETPGWRCEVEVIDVLTSPERAEEERILATPTLIKESPLPRRRVTGDLSDSEKVLRVVGPVQTAIDPPRRQS
jgi:circadian clock protein KaiB